MAYVLPRVLVYQEFRVAPTATEAPRQAHIAGGHARLFRYDDEDEKATIGLGQYDPVSDQAYEWPERPDGAQVDFDYTKLYCDGALLQYFADLIGVGGLVVPVADYKNRVRSAAHSFKENTEDYPRSEDLYDRDVKVGDTVYVRGVETSSGDSFELWTTVTGFSGDLVAPVTGSATDADTNKADQSYEVSVDELSGLKNTITLTADGSNYDGRELGDIDETYTIEVTRSSINGDLTTARLRVTTASGHDQDSDVQPAGVGGFTLIGDRNLKIEFDRNETTSASSAAGLDEISPDDLVVGQKWKVRVKQAFTAAVATSGGTYSGTKNTTYIIEVTKGGAFAAEPEVTVTTTTGVDKSGPTKITAASTAFAVGTKDITVSFAGSSGLCKGDKYYIEVEAEKEGSMQTLILADDLPEEIQDATDLDLKLFIKKDIVIEKNRVTAPPLTNYSQSDTEFTVESGITLYDSTWTDDGEQLPLPLKGGELFLQYRAWLPTYIGEFESADDVANLPDLLGQASPDNPLYWGVFMALQNSNGQPVRFTAVEDPNDVDHWFDALEILVGRDDLYNLVPLTLNKTVIDAWKSHVESQSSPENGRWRGMFCGISVPDEKAIVSADTTSDGEVALATLSDDPLTSGTQYTRLSVPAGNAKFLTNDVEPGDKVRFLYSTDGFDNDTWTEFTVDEVLSENTLRLSDGNDIAISVPQKVEIWRNLKGAGLASAVVDEVGRLSSRRVCAIVNETVGNAGQSFPGYFLACALAGLRSAVNPHQGLTNVEIAGIDDVGTLVKGLNSVHLNTIAAAGGWIVVKAKDGSIITRHALTTDNTDLNRREEMIRVNVDSISYTLLAILEPYIGKSNVVDSVLLMMRNSLSSALDEMTIDRTPRIGPQLVGYEIVELRQHALLKDRVVITINLTVPYPINNIELRLVV